MLWQKLQVKIAYLQIRSNFSGLIIEFGSVCTVLLASNLGIPVSTTHCLVGAVVLVGLVRSRHVTGWKLFSSILIAWLVTVPVSGITH